MGMGRGMRGPSRFQGRGFLPGGRGPWMPRPYPPRFPPRRMPNLQQYGQRNFRPAPRMPSFRPPFRRGFGGFGGGAYGVPSGIESLLTAQRNPYFRPPTAPRRPSPGYPGKGGRFPWMQPPRTQIPPPVTPPIDGQVPPPQPPVTPPV